jgi:hypothetical protein
LKIKGQKREQIIIEPKQNTHLGMEIPSGDVEATVLVIQTGHPGVPTAVSEELLWSCSLNLHHHWHLDYYKAEAEC